MAITYASSTITLTNGYDYGTATGGSTTTLVDSSKSWGANVLVGRLVWIKAGTRQHAVGLCTSHTGNTITCSGGFYKFNTTTKVVEAVTPASGDTYAVCYTMADIIAAQPTYAAWVITGREATIAANISLTNGAALQCVDEMWRFTGNRQGVSSAVGTFWQVGQMLNGLLPLDAAKGGEVLVRLATTGAYWEVPLLGKCRFFGATIRQSREIADGVNTYTRWNLPGGTADGLEFYNSIVDGIIVQLSSGRDIVVRTIGLRDNNFMIDSSPLLFSGNRSQIGPRPGSGNEFGVRGADIIDHVQTTAMFLYLYTLTNKAVAYFWNHTSYTSDWTTAFTWYDNVGDGHVYRGYLVALDVKDSSGNGLSDVVLSVAKTSTGAGAILTAKTSGYLPTLSTTVVTTGGKYTGIVGSNEGLPILYARYTRTSLNVSAETLYGPYTFKAGKYGYFCQSYSKNWAERSKESLTMATNNFLVSTQAQALAHPIGHSTGVYSLTAELTADAIRKLYEFAQADYIVSRSLEGNEPMTTTDGVNFSLTSGFTISLGATYAFTDTTRRIAGEIRLTAAGAYPLRLGTSTITFTTAGTYDLSGADLGGTITMVNTSGGAVVVQIASGVSYINTGPNITVQEPQVYQSVTINGLTSGYRVQLYDLTGDEELYNDIVSTTTLTWEDTVAYSADREIRLRVMYADGTAIQMEDRVIGTSTASTPAVAYSFSSVEDTVYEQNGIDGSTVTGITITDGTMLLNINSGTVTQIGVVDVVVVNIKNIYAYETYWLFTEEGIRDEARFINAIDGANYEFIDFKIKNNTGYPVAIVGGYVRDSATNSSLTLTDYSGGDIHYTPDHVVNNVVTITGGNVITGDIADIPTAPTVVEIRQEMDANSSKLRDGLTLGQFIALK